MEAYLTNFKEALTEVWQTTRIAPNSGKLWVDILLLLVVAAVNYVILPSTVNGYLYVDLMTPWLVTCFVLSPLNKSIVLALIAAWIAETHSVAPAGLYFCIYWIIGVGVHVSRSTLSWRHMTPWSLTFLASGLWIFFFETFVQSINSPPMLLNLRYLYQQVSEVICTVLLGLILSERFRRLGMFEDAY